MNSMAVVYARNEGERRPEALIIDSGVSFRDAHYGVDVVHPRFDRISEIGANIVGLVLTHGHEDHIGGTPYMLKQFARDGEFPTCGSAHVHALLDHRAKEHDILRYRRSAVLRAGKTLSLGAFDVLPVPTDHSAPDAFGLRIATPEGTLFHTGDFKFETGDVEGPLLEVGEAGVDLLMSDSTNAEHATRPGSEALVASALYKHIAAAEGAAVVSLFASNTERLQSLFRIAEETHRTVALLGRSMATHVEIAMGLGKINPQARLVSPGRLEEVPRNQLLVLVTGSQGEPRGALSRLSRNEMREFTLQEDDTVILSSRVIPGNELSLAEVESALLRLGVRLVAARHDHNIHVSGHAARDEQKRMIEWTAPANFLPIHGTRAHLEAHAATARAQGVPQTFVRENGEELLLDDGRVCLGDTFEAGIVRRIAGLPLPLAALRERREGAARGLVIIALGRGKPIVATWGIADDRTKSALEQEIAKEIASALVGGMPGEHIRTATGIANRIVRRDYGYKPMITVRE
jgi:ribonuclease J